MVTVFPINKRAVINFDQWSLRDLIAHLSAWNLLNVEHIKAIKEDKNPLWIADVDEFNKNEIRKRKSLGWDDIYREFINSGELLINTFRSLPDGLWDKECGFKNRYTPRKYLFGMMDEYEQHSLQLKKYLNSRHS